MRLVSSPDRDGALAQALAAIEERDRAIDALTREGDWAESQDERMALRGTRW